MNKEEREIIYTLEGSIDTYIEDTKVIKVQLTTKQAEILLNLISKLQKENKELKEDNSHQWEERCRLTFELERLQEENQELKEENKELKKDY